jgi:hypothetical protein
MVPGIVLAQNGTELSTTAGAVTEWNVMGASEHFVVPANAVNPITWQFSPLDGLNWDPSMAVIDGNGRGATVTAASCGAVAVTATGNSTGTKVYYYGEKKWGEIDHTVLTQDLGPDLTPGSTQMQWTELTKTWSGSGSVTETVIGKFRFNWESAGYWDTHVAGGAVVYWYLFHETLDPGYYNLNRLDTGTNLIAQLTLLQATYAAKYVDFTTGTGSGTTMTTTVSGSDGTTSVDFSATAEEGVRIICVATYPNNPTEYLVRPEFTSWNFWTQEMEKVPQVRWAGEKIVLEKYWGEGFESSSQRSRYIVHYELENGSPGVLEGLTDPALLGENLLNDATSVWTSIAADGVSRVILTSEKPGECDVTCSLYYRETGGALSPKTLVNQHGFVVFFLKLESITLTEVAGYRDGHNSGYWNPDNPVIDQPDPYYSDIDEPLGQMIVESEESEANVSEDELLRVRVRGWFMGDDLSIREKDYCDVNGNGKLDMYDYVLPEGRWVLPDDWEFLAGSSWTEFRPNWDIMTDAAIPMMTASDPLGPYGYYDLLYNWVTVAPYPVIGPYSSLDGNANLPYTSMDGHRHTIVPDGILNWWDCPMPPAKVTFEILSGVGFFKEASKADMYWDYGYTNPYYAIEIPANSQIPPTCNNGGYDWDSWGFNGVVQQGPYFFWDIINKLNNGPVTSSDPGAYPTKVQVYSDNHGEAMVYINGDWNLNLPVTPKGFIDVDYMTEVGQTTVVAFADYPYMRKQPAITSNIVENTWFWGKDIVILVEQLKGANGLADPTNKRIWVLVSDRDEFAVTGETIEWYILNGSPAMIYSGAGSFRYGYADPTAKDGWSNPGNKTIATTVTYLPTNLMWWNATAGHPVSGWVTEEVYLENLFGIDLTPPHGDGVPEHAYGISWIIVNAGQGSSVYLKLLLDESVRPNGLPGEGVIERRARSAGQSIDVLDFSQSGQGAGQDPCDPTEKLTIGWNLISFKSGNQSVADAINSIVDKVVSVWAFNNETKTWKAYSPTAPSWANDLKSMDSSTSYWIEVSSDVMWAY